MKIFLLGFTLAIGITYFLITLRSEKPIQNIETIMPAQNNYLMAWIYPGDPACSAPSEFKKWQIDVLKPEYFLITDGSLTLLTETEHGCNGYSEKNISEIKKYSQQQFATVAAADSGGIEIFLDAALADQQTVNELVDFAVENEITGIEIDFEDFAAWDENLYQKYKDFLTLLGNRLHQNNKQLMIDGPAISNETEQNYFVWRYNDFKDLPVDRIVVMAYDYQFDHGPGTPITPLDWLEQIAIRTTNDLGSNQKLTIGLPSYGYKAEIGTQDFELLNFEQIKNEPGFETATRDQSSGELTWTRENIVYFYSDTTTLNQKKAVLDKNNIRSISVWHLGGNQWFAE